MIGSNARKHRIELSAVAAAAGAGEGEVKASIRVLLLRLLVAGVAAVLAACTPSKALESELTRSVLTEEELGKLLANLDCRKCMHKASSGEFTKPEDVAASCAWLPNASLIAMVTSASEKRVIKECFPPPEPFLPKDFQCYAHSRIQFRKQIVLRDDGKINNTDAFRTIYDFGRYAGLMNGIQVLPDHRYLIFSIRDPGLPRTKGPEFGPLYDSPYHLMTACDLDQQPSLPILEEITTDEITKKSN